MKRMALIGLVLSLCVALVACAAADPDNLFEVTAGGAASATDPSGDTIAAQQTGEEYYQYGNMQKGYSLGNYMLLGNEVIFRYIDGGRYRLYTYNLEDGMVFPYCKDATCTHRGSCSYGTLGGAVEVYKGRIYSRNTNLQPVELTETGQQILAPKVTGAAFHHDDNLYVRTQDSSLVVFEDGSDEYRVILDEYIGFGNVIFGKYLYANDGAAIIRIDLSAEQAKEEVLVSDAFGLVDGRHIYYVDLKNNHLYRCNMDGSEPQLLVEQPVLPASLNFDDEYFYYRLFIDNQVDTGADCCDLYRIVKSNPSKIEKIATLPTAIFQAHTVPGTGIIFVTSYQCSNGEDNDIYVMNTDGTGLVRVEIPEY